MIKVRTYGYVRNDRETHWTGVTGLHSRLRRSCNTVTQSRAIPCHFAHNHAFSLYSHTYLYDNLFAMYLQYYVYHLVMVILKGNLSQLISNTNIPNIYIIII